MENTAHFTQGDRDLMVEMNTKLERALLDIKELSQGFISKQEFSLEIRDIEKKIADLEKQTKVDYYQNRQDITKHEAYHKTKEEDEKKQKTIEMEKKSGWIVWFLRYGLIPLIFTILGLVLTKLGIINLN